jgi:hypothetical protein
MEKLGRVVVVVLSNSRRWRRCSAQAAMVVLLVGQSVAPGVVLGWTRRRYQRRRGELWKPARRVFRMDECGVR